MKIYKHSFAIEPFSAEETLAFLTDSNDYEIRKGIALWAKYTTRRTLLFAPVKHKFTHNARLEPYYWDEIASRFRYFSSDKLVPLDIIRTDVFRMASGVRQELRELSQNLVNDKISLEVWYREARLLMRDSYRNSWLASIGGYYNYDKAQMAYFGNAVAPQYKYFDNFLSEIQSGKQKLDGTLVNRAGMYGDATNTVYENARFDKAMRDGKGFCCRIRTLSESCPTCEEEAAKGYVPMEEAVPIGDSECMSHCRCYYLFSNNEFGD